MKQLTYEMQEIFNSEFSYRNSFVNEDSFENKRFNRYVEKVKEFIFEKYLKVIYFKLFEHKENPCLNLTDFIIGFFQQYYLGDLDESKIKDTLFSAIYNYTIPNIDILCNNEFLEKYLTNPYTSKISNKNKDGGRFLSLEVVINEETRKVCKEFIKIKSLELGNIDISNYFLTLPQNTKDAIFIFDSIINYVRVDIEHLCGSHMTSDFINLLNDDILNSLDKKNEDLSSQVKELNNELSIKEQNIKNLNTKLTEKNYETNDDIEILLEQNITLERQNIKIKDKYNQLLDKYKSLKKEFIDETNNLNQDDLEVPFKSLNLEGRYLFVASEDISFEKIILNEFPNATFCDSNININLFTDLVIVLTEHIDHSTYYGIKEQCKNKKIPFIHCRFSNVELIKELMWNCLNL